MQNRYIKKTYYPKILSLCVALLLAIACVSDGYAQTNESVSCQMEAENAPKNGNRASQLLIIVVSCAVWIIGYNFFSSKALLKKTSNEKKSLKEENSQLKLMNEMQQIKRENERKIAQLKLKQLNKEVRHKKTLLLQHITEHINLSKRIQQHKNTEKIPQWLENYLSKYSYANATNWNRFLTEFEGVFPKFLFFIKENYSMLTENDMQYLILAILGLDINDIAFVLNKTTRTIWNRRDTIKSRLALGDISIESWLDTLMDSYQKQYRELLDEQDQDE